MVRMVSQDQYLEAEKREKKGLLPLVGKGDRNRTRDVNKFRDNYDKVFGKRVAKPYPGTSYAWQGRSCKRG